MIQTVTKLHASGQPRASNSSGPVPAVVEPDTPGLATELAAVRFDDQSTHESDDSGSLLRKALIDAGKITDTEFRRLLRVKEESPQRKSVVSLLVGLGLVSEQYLAELLAKTFDLPQVSSSDLLENPEAKVDISPRCLR